MLTKTEIITINVNGGGQITEGRKRAATQYMYFVLNFVRVVSFDERKVGDQNVATAACLPVLSMLWKLIADE